MADRDVEKNVPTTQFVETLRRLADALEAGESFRIQVQNRRFTVPADSEITIEHEVEDGEEELAMELHWTSD
ncbi:MAG: amphi-Trp domain-containing protein [Actinomycetota bacterium]